MFAVTFPTFPDIVCIWKHSCAYVTQALQPENVT